jgi:hypothetical protein
MTQFDDQLSTLRADLRSTRRRKQRLFFASLTLLGLVFICAVLAR